MLRFLSTKQGLLGNAVPRAVLLVVYAATACAARGDSGATAVARPFAAGEDVRRLPLVAQGFCLVTLRNQQRWERGDPRAAAAFDGHEYRFVGPREQAIFLAAPERYAPALGGDCPATFATTKQRRPGQLDCAMVHRGRLYFFADQDSLRAFSEAPHRFENVDLADGGNCPVCRGTLDRRVAGNPATTAIHNGIRYLFDNAHHRAQFLADPRAFVDSPRNETSQQIVGNSLPGLPAHIATESDLQPAYKSTDGGMESSGGREVFLDSLPAMGGYCPVTIRQNGLWVRGRYDYRAEFGNLVFLTAGPGELDALLNDPVRYIPALGGDCVVTLVDDGQRARGSIFHAAEYGGRLFLFADAQRKAAFKADPERYSRVDVAAGGTCRVTQVDEGRTAPGLPKLAAWREGLIYYFAGPDQRQRFLDAPERYVVPPTATAEASPGESTAP